MSSAVLTPPHIDLALFHRMLDTDDDIPLVELVDRAGHISRGLRFLVMTVLQRDGIVGTGSADELRRLAERTTFYRKIADACGALGARPVKGPALADWYPDDLPRPMNDLDLAVPDEATLWRVVGAIVEGHRPTTMDVTVFGGRPRHFFVSLAWPGADPLLDRDLRIEISTCALLGDNAAVPFRAELPADPVAAALLGVAEERFQRPLNAKDAVDAIMVLTPGHTPDLPLLVRESARLRLAPELLELLDLTRSATDLLDHLPREFRTGLEAAATHEQERRDEWHRHNSPVPAGPERDFDGEWIRMALEAPRSTVYGMQLTSLNEGVRANRDPRRAVVHDFGAGFLLLTPAADFLLVPGGKVGQDLYDGAMTALTALG
ncbi:hypothetical protein [Streptomyces cavernae]|uniref:hypothetical protein n=1 Tax=Streptomyces cavernae TaxID=2259034 RepID=UPI000FEBE74A|nr:hypothetical protein [Streptomyces cavernae]